MSVAGFTHRIKRYRTLQTHKISSLPLAILMPHSACNCRCVMCDIWKGNAHLKQLTRKDIEQLLPVFEKLGTKKILLSGGEALLHPAFFDLCALLQGAGLKICLLSTGITIGKHAESILAKTDELIVSLDGDKVLHNHIRNLPGAFEKLREGVQHIKKLNPYYPLSSRTVIHRLNFRKWQNMIDTGTEMGLDRMSFLPADLSSQAFNRAQPWDNERQSGILPDKKELVEMKTILEELIVKNPVLFEEGFIAESPAKLRNILQYYQAVHGEAAFPYKKCNAPWVSVVIEPDGSVRPCFFHAVQGNIHEQPLEKILNSEASVRFRKELNLDTNDTCMRCVCSLNLRPGINP